MTFVHVTPVEEIRGGRGGAHALTHREEIDESETALKDAAAAADAGGRVLRGRAVLGETVETIVALADFEEGGPDRPRLSRTEHHRIGRSRQHLAGRAPARIAAGSHRQGRQGAG